MRFLTLAAALIALAGCTPERRVGSMDDGSAILPTGARIRGVGEQIIFPGRPVDAALSKDGKQLYVKDKNNLRVIDTASWKELGSAPIPKGASLWGIRVHPNGHVFVTNSASSIFEYTIDEAGKPTQTSEITLPEAEVKGPPFPCGFTITPDGRTILVCLSRSNTVGVVHLETKEVTDEIPVGIAPYDAELSPDGRTLFVSCQGGDRAEEGDETAMSAGTPVPIDKRGIAAHGSLNMISLAEGRVVKSLVTDLQPSDILISRGTVYSANANGDSISSFDLDGKPKETIIVKPDLKLPYGSMPTALAVSDDGKTLLAAEAGTDSMAVIDVTGKKAKVTGFIPTDWFPTAICIKGKTIYGVNNKGVGSRSSKANKHNSHETTGSLRKINWPTTDELKEWTSQVKEDMGVPAILAAYERSTNSKVPPVAIPEKLGEPSLIKHVVYVIKENRTFDQVFGDMGKGEVDPKLCMFGEEITPNQHALARQFALLDNYYCNSVLSADGHSWVTEGNVTPYLNRAFGGFTRSYTTGDDPITYSASGFVWDGILAAGLSFRNYGEFDAAEPEEKMSGREIWAKYKAGEHIKFKSTYLVTNQRRYTDLDYPGWNMQIPDQLRMDRFMTEFREYEKNGDFPNFVEIYLPQDHTGGWVTPKANVADNDLAVGRLVDAISHSQFWKDTAIFIIEDDPQNGFDHIDGHRSTCLVISPYVKRSSVVSNFYNQDSVLHTICQIFGIAPMNSMTANGPLMSACFTNEPDLSPFTVIPNKVPLDETASTSTIAPPEDKIWLEAMKKLDIGEREVQDYRDMDILNRALWHYMKGANAPYPEDYAGAHGKGLKKLGLALASEFGITTDEDDDN